MAPITSGCGAHLDPELCASDREREPGDNREGEQQVQPEAWESARKRRCLSHDGSWGTRGKGGVLVTKAVETQKAKAVETHGRGGVLAATAVGNTRQRQCPSRDKHTAKTVS